MQRVFDILIAGIVFLLVLPLFLPIMIVLRFTGEGEIFYRQERVGRFGKPFDMIKFATMLKNSPNMKNAFITTKNDPRVLPIGRFLRKSKLNEIPQLLNILKGDISIVGPRPQVKSHLDLYPPQKAREILEIMPGLTGIASIFFRDEETMIAHSKMDPKEFYKRYIIPYKVDLELWYKNHMSIVTYIKVIILTAIAIILPNKHYMFIFFRDLPVPPKQLQQ